MKMKKKKGKVGNFELKIQEKARKKIKIIIVVSKIVKNS
jgi:hypothetical protein